jgi:hypothetical protein
MGGLQRCIDLLDAGQELLHRGDQLFLQQGDLFLAIGVIDPKAADWLSPVSAQQLCERLVAGVDEGDGILAGEGIEPEGQGPGAVAQRWDASSTAGSGKGREAPCAALAPADDARSHRQPQRGQPRCWALRPTRP